MMLSKDIFEKVVNEFRESSTVDSSIIDNVYNEFIQRGTTTSNEPSYLRFMFTEVVKCAVAKG